MPRTRMTKKWEYKRVPSIYIPIKSRVTEDQSKYFLKSPAEMSRHEIAELERTVKMVDEPLDIDIDEFKKTEEFLDLK